MKAFWWFEADRIAGMARPGFNFVRWFDLSFEEAALLSWIGQYSCGSHDLAPFRTHLKHYVPRIFKFYQLSPEAGAQAIRVFDDVSGISQVLARLAERTSIFANCNVDSESVQIKVCQDRLETEIAFLKKQSIRQLVTLTERHHSKAILANHFQVHHIGIEDLNVPHLEQVQYLADVMTMARQNDEGLAVHCLAGIGRTSTMLIAAQLLMGETLETLQARIAIQNPSFVLAGPQGDFLRSIAHRYAGTRSNI